MRPRHPSSTLPLAALAALALAACDGGAGTPPPGGRDAGPRMDTGVVVPPSGCARPSEGCECPTEGATLDCYPDAETNPDGSRTCFRGTRTCRDGVWSGCESLDSWVDDGPGGDVGRAGAGLIGTTEECDDCNPACSTTTDEPDCGDVDPADGLECCGPPDGLCLIPMEPPPPPPPPGCDIYYEVGYRATADHTYTFTLPSASADVSVYAEDVTANGINEEYLVDSTSIVAASCGACLPGAVGAECQGCSAGETVSWDLTFQNLIVLPTTTDQILELDLIVVENAMTAPLELDRQRVCLFVEAIDPAECRDLGSACGAASECCTGICAQPPGSSGGDWVDGDGGVCASTAATCFGEGGACTITAECCEGACSGGVCVSGATCGDPGDSCTVDGDCCGNDCTGGVCQARTCSPQNALCSADGDCCSGNCRATGMTTKCGSGPSVACAVTGASCTAPDDCCTGVCTSGRCERLTFCRPLGDVCTADDQCCGLSCDGGFCQNTVFECLPRYERCSSASECCGFDCQADEAGVERCSAYAACGVSGFNVGGTVFGDTCTFGAQCCSGLCGADAYGDLRCYRANSANAGCDPVPNPDGEVCNQDCDCANTFDADPRGGCFMFSGGLSGSRRCAQCDPSDSTCACTTDGGSCGVSSDCCAGVCALWPDDPPGCTPGVDCDVEAGFYCGLPPEYVFTTGTFERTWDGLEATRGDGTPGCASNERPDWSDFSWSATIPAGTEISFSVQTSDTLAGLDTATAVTFTDPSATPPVDIGELLVGAGQPNFMQYLRITVTLTSITGAATPVIHDFTLEYICTPTE